MCGLERDYIDEEVEAVGDSECPVLVTVESDIPEVPVVPLVPCADGQRPVVGAQRLRDGAADTAGTEDESATRDLAG